MSKTVLIVGGYGVFGGRLAVALSKNRELNVLVAGRDRRKADDFCQGTQCHPFEINRKADNLKERIKQASPFIVIDAAGPFQNYGDEAYNLVEAALGASAHYLDLSDDAAFTEGIGQFDEAAKAKHLTVLSGVSSVPALSSTVVDTLVRDMEDVHLITSAILPGNKAPRGLSVIKAIISQAGQPLSVWRAGQYKSVPGWSGSKPFRMELASKQKRLRRVGSYIGAPDLRLFPYRYRARNVSFRAGLDLTLMHRGLWLLSWLVRRGVMKSLLPLAVPLKIIAQGLERFGSDTGAMIVETAGLTDQGTPIRKTWTLVVEDGNGPNIPTIPAQILISKLAEGTVPAGAGACLGAFSLAEAEIALKALSVNTSIEECRVPLVFQSILKTDFEHLEPQHRDLHTVIDFRRWKGRASVKRGRTVLSKIAGAIAGFPGAKDDIDVTVEMERTRQGETWTRTFGSKRFRSYLSSGTRNERPVLFERFGAMKFEIALALEDGRLRFPVQRGSIFGVALPKLLLPLSNAEEYLDQNGRARFKVDLSLPICGHVATYSGWLEPADKPASGSGSI